ncbi:hypothetical protein LFX13_19445, partial [Leptospira bandrabouensis]|nr:hypothetical protein [Leptospira bandrabouensis]
MIDLSFGIDYDSSSVPETLHAETRFVVSARVSNSEKAFKRFMMRERKDHSKTIAIRVNRIGLKGELRLPLHSKLRVISVVGEKEARHLERFDSLFRTLDA